MLNTDCLPLAAGADVNAIVDLAGELLTATGAKRSATAVGSAGVLHLSTWAQVRPTM